MLSLNRKLRLLVGLDTIMPTDSDFVDFITWAQREFVLQRFILANPALLPRELILADIAADIMPMTDRDERMLRYESERIERALMHLGVKILLLKGAAYVLADKQAGMARRVSDIDILVSEDDLKIIEKSLLAAGWSFEVKTDNLYDQMYYRRHMHELPPLHHKHRNTLLDVHHMILPRTAKYHPSSDELLDKSVSIDGSTLHILCSEDMFLHSACHMFLDGNFNNPIRSLLELFDLFSELTDVEISSLKDRAITLGVLPALTYACWALSTFWQDDRAALLSNDLPSPNWLVSTAMALRAKAQSRSYIAELILEIRAHLLRMPPLMLAKHLSVKIIRKLKPSFKKQ